MSVADEAAEFLHQWATAEEKEAQEARELEKEWEGWASLTTDEEGLD